MGCRIDEFCLWIIIPCMMRIVVMYILRGFLVACVEVGFGDDDEGCWIIDV